jgi:general stress protein 26
MAARSPLVVGATLFAVAIASAQTPAAAPDRAKVLKVAAQVMQAAVFCDLITVGAAGQPQSRIVQPQPPDAEFVVWVGTNPLSRKVGEIERNPAVTLSYFDRAKLRFVTVLGRASVIRDPEEKAKHWTDAWVPFYKDKFRGDDFVLLKIVPNRLEVVSAADGIVNDPKTWRPVTINLK